MEEAFRDDDAYIAGLIDAAEDAVERHLDVCLGCIEVAAGELPPAVKSAILLLVGNLYANREPVVFSSTNRIPYTVKVPYTFEYLLSLYRNYGGGGCV